MDNGMIDDDRADLLMRGGVAAFCADCGGERIFLPIEEGCAFDGCEFCCTECDAAVFLMQILENTGLAHAHVA